MGITSEAKTDGLTGIELAAAGNFSHFVVKGQLTNILDLTNSSSLLEFYKQIKKIELPFYYKDKASKLKISPMLPVKNIDELHETLFAENWRLMPMQFDVPANSQVLGQIASSAGLDGILYPSVRSHKKALAIYPQNFVNSESYIEIIGKVAESVKGTRIDKNTYKNFMPSSC